MSSTSSNTPAIIASFIVQFQDTECNINVVIDTSDIITTNKVAFTKVDDIDPTNTNTNTTNDFVATTATDTINEFVLFEDSCYKFGVVKLKMAEIEKSTEPIDLHAVSDISGSMSEPASSTNVATKGAVMNHVLKNVSSIIAENNESGSKVALCIDGFDDKIKKVIPYSALTFENIIDNNKKIDLFLQPKGMTNIKLAMDEFIKEQERRDAQSLEYGLIEHKLCALDGNTHKLMVTDGSDTCGNSDNAVLAALVDTSKSYYFIGLGVGHNAELLKCMAEPEDCEYHFVPSAEESGPIIATIIHKMYYTILRKSIVTIVGGEIYNYKTNSWTTTLYVGSLTSEATKSWHIRTQNDIADVKVFLRATDGFIVLAKDQGFANLHYNMLRQRTLELLYAASHISKELGHKETKIFTKKMHQFFEYLNRYIKTHNLEKCLDHKTLCDDIYIAIQTFGTKLGQLFSGSRGESQETSAAYAISDISSALPAVPKRRQNAQFDGFAASAASTMPAAPYKISRITSSATPTQRGLMRQTSAETGSADLDEVEDEAYVYVSDAV
jgi:hypothetical protein